MKKKNVLKIVLCSSAFTLMSLSAVSASIFTNRKELIKTEAATFPTTIDLNDCSDDEIRSYYSSFNNMSAEELSGTNLLKNLKGIIGKNVTYFSYNNDTEIFAITDRDWTNSPASAIAGYDASTNKINNYKKSTDISSNPYIRMLYNDYSLQSKTRYSGDGDVSTSTKSFDNEHVWSQSHGFSGGGDSSTGAGSDLHHLMAGTQYGNRTLHSNYSYGFVKTLDWDESSVPAVEKKNKRGTPLFTHSEDQQGRVFEPQDSDKGDVARALLYMVACYNNYDGSTPTKEMPALQLVNYIISENTKGYSSDDLKNGYYGSLQDILAWHKMDPVDEYEIHRNNLIYRNYQHNRNPFIDYPEWVDYIWGASEYDVTTKTIAYNPESTGSANLEEDVINGYQPTIPVSKLEITSQPTKKEYKTGEELDKTGLVITATFEDNSTKDVTRSCKFTYDFSKVGKQTVTATYKGHTVTFEVNVARKGPDWKMIAIIIAVVVVVILVIVCISIGVLKVNKKGKIKVNKSGVKKLANGSSKSKTSSKKKK